MRVKRLNNLFLLLAILLLNPPSLTAQTRSTRFDRLSLERGLSQSTVTCILQDSIGFMWFGTQDGLNRYDGYSFAVYKNDPTDPSTLASDSILDLVEDPSGDLWIGTEGGGLNRWSRAEDSFIRYQANPADPHTLSSNQVRTLLLDRAGMLWIGTHESGLNRLDPATFKVDRLRTDPNDPTSLSDNRIRALFEDRLGNLWVGTLGGLNLFDPATESFVRFQHDPLISSSLNDDRIRSILEDDSGTLWVGTYGGGLDQLDRITLTFTHYVNDPAEPSSLSENRVRALFEDSDQRLWVGTDGGLNLLQRSSQSFSRYQHNPGDLTSLSANRITSIYQDRGGVLWIGTQGGGVNKWNPSTWSFSHFKHDPENARSLSDNGVFAFSEDSEGKLWIGTLGGGLNALDRTSGVFTHYRNNSTDSSSLSDDLVVALLHDRSERLWIGTVAGGLNRFDPESSAFERFVHDPSQPGSLAANGVMALFEDRQGNLWVGTYGGGLDLFERSRGGFLHFRHDPADASSLSNDRVSCLAEGSADTLWVGTDGGGLNLFDRETKSFLRIQHDSQKQDSLRNDIVTALHVDRHQVLWVGTQGGGLHRLEKLEYGNATFKNYSEREGLPNEVIYGIHSAPSGELWMSTNNGLSRFDPESRMFKNYDISHGLQSDEFNHGAHYQSSSGEIFFGGVNGFNTFFPDRIQRNTYNPPLVLSSLLILGRPARSGLPLYQLTEVTLDYSDYVFSVECSALEYSAPERSRYAYRLEGLDDHWIDLGEYRRMTFTNLDPGRYVLRVKGSNNDDVWSEGALAITINIKPPPWRAWWAYGLYALTLIGVFLLYLKGQRKKAEHQEILRKAKEAAEDSNRAKDEFLACMSHELRTPMNGVIGMASVLAETPLSEMQQQYLEMISRSGASLMTIISDILDFSKIESRKLKIENAPFDLRSLIEDSLDLIAPTAAQRDLSLAYRIEDGCIEAIIADGGRTQQILLNLLGNAVKFTQSGEVLVTLSSRQASHERSTAHFSVKDTGIGIPAERLDRLFQPFSQVDGSMTRRYGGTGLGLAICKRLTELMGGRIWIESTEGEGSTVHFTVLGKRAPAADRSFLFRVDPFLAGKRILIAERNAMVSRLLSRQVSCWGMEPETAGSIAEAFKKLRSFRPFDFALMDRDVVEQNGERWAREIAEVCRSRKIPVVLLVGLAQEAAGEYPGMMEPDGVLNRPVKPALLHRSLIDVLPGAPARRKEHVQVPENNPSREESRPLRIIVAEDNVANQEVVLLLLERLGYRADFAANGLEVLAALDREPYEVVLMDVQMPEMDGLETTRRIRELPPDRQPFIIAMTAYAMRGDRERCLEAGMDDYLSKPIQVPHLKAALFGAMAAAAV